MNGPTSSTLTPPPPIRSASMVRRRNAILDQARRIIGQQGFDALTLRDLAKAARVTVPTIYNLVGNKQALLLTLLDDLVQRLESQLTPEHYPDPLGMAEAVILESTALFQADEDFSRAALLVAEHIERQLSDEAESTMQGISMRAVQLPINACQAARDAGLLRGAIAPQTLGQQIYRGYRTAWRDWAYRLADNQTFQNQGLIAVYICLAADAVPSFHEELARRIAALNAADPCAMKA